MAHDSPHNDIPFGIKKMRRDVRNWHRGAIVPVDLGTAGILATTDPGRVKTSKGRSRTGIFFYRGRGFRVVFATACGKLGLEKQVILRVIHARAF